MHDHLASLVVQVRPTQEGPVCAAIAAMGAEIHTVHRGKVVVTLETASESAIADAMTRMTLLDGVFSATLVFHYHEEASS